MYILLGSFMQQHIKYATTSLQWILTSTYHQLYQATLDHIIATNTSLYQPEPSSMPTHSSHVLWSGGTPSQETSWSPHRLRPSRGLWLWASNCSWSVLLAPCTIRTFTYALLMDKVSPLVLYPASWILPSTEVEAEVEGRMSQTGPKKCFIPKIVKNTPILIEQSIACNVLHLTPISYISLESLYSMDVIYANINVKIQGV